MKNNRLLTEKELNYISRNIKSTTKGTLWLYIIALSMVIFTGIIVYSEDNSPSAFIILLFVILLFLVQILFRIYKGYKKYLFDPIVYKKSGVYKSIYIRISHKSGRDLDIINNEVVKIPWHWRKYIKKQKGKITYEYVAKDGVVTANEFYTNYVVSINDTLSLTYELNNGLSKTKPVSPFDYICLMLLAFPLFLSSVTTNIDEALKINHTFKKPEENTIQIKNTNELNTLSTSNYVKIDSAWIFHLKTFNYGASYLVTKTERDRIFNHPDSYTSFKYYSDYRNYKKPDKDKIKKEFIDNAKIIDNSIKKMLSYTTDSNNIDNIAADFYKGELERYTRKVKSSKKNKKLIEELSPKGFFVRIRYDVFKQDDKERLSSIGRSLREPYTSIRGFYIKSERKLVSYEEQKRNNKKIREEFIMFSVFVFSLIITLYISFKIVYNTIIKLRLVKEQLNKNYPMRIE